MTVIVVGSTIWVIFAGMTHFHPALAFNFPQNAFHLNHGFFIGLGASTLIALYDYFGYNNTCMIGNEISNPGKVIPQSILFSILLTGVIYLVMNLSIIGVLPWREAMNSQAIVSDFMMHLYGGWAANLITVLVLIAAFGSVYAIILGLSRIPYAAAVDGHFFSIFSRLHPKGKFPYVSLLGIGFLSSLACFFSLDNLITSLIVAQTLMQSVALCVAVIFLRRQRPAGSSSYKMPLYPLPALIALVGWIYIIGTSKLQYIALAFLFLFMGLGIFLLRTHKKATWPFGAKDRITTNS